MSDPDVSSMPREDEAVAGPAAGRLRPRRSAFAFAGLSGLLLAATVASLGLGATRLSPAEVVDALVGRSGADPIARTILVELRLPRALLAALIGVALGAAGAAYQALFRNPLADPFVVGASSGAAFGAAVVIVTGWAGPRVGDRAGVVRGLPRGAGRGRPGLFRRDRGERAAGQPAARRGGGEHDARRRWSGW